MLKQELRHNPHKVLISIHYEIHAVLPTGELSGEVLDRDTKKYILSAVDNEDANTKINKLLESVKNESD